jgi:hypothetical protein
LARHFLLRTKRRHESCGTRSLGSCKESPSEKPKRISIGKPSVGKVDASGAERGDEEGARRAQTLPLIYLSKLSLKPDVPTEFFASRNQRASEMANLTRNVKMNFDTISASPKGAFSHGF